MDRRLLRLLDNKYPGPSIHAHKTVQSMCNCTMCKQIYKFMPSQGFHSLSRQPNLFCSPAQKQSQMTDWYLYCYLKRWYINLTQINGLLQYLQNSAKSQPSEEWSGAGGRWGGMKKDVGMHINVTSFTPIRNIWPSLH